MSEYGKPKTQQAIDAVRARLARGQISEADARIQITKLRLDHYNAMYRTLLDEAEQLQHSDDIELPRVRRFPHGHNESQLAPADMTLTGHVDVVGMLLAEMDRHFRLSEVTDPQPHRRGVLVEATIAPHFYLDTPREGGPQ